MMVAVLVGAALIAAWGIVHRRRSPPRFERVAARLESDGTISVAPPAELTKVKLGSSTRTALRAPLEQAVAVGIDPNTTRLTLSLGLRDKRPARSVTFSISAQGASGRQTLLSETIQTPFDGWRERSIDVGHFTPPVSALRLEVSGGAADASEAYWGGLSALQPSVDPIPPNLILISLDTLGADHLSFFGGPAGVSPKMDAILGRSFTFRRAYAQYPNTPVSHASLFSGLYPRHHGVYETTPWFRVKATLAAVLAAHGYTTVAFTEDGFVSSDFGFDRGFDFYDNSVAETVNAGDDTLGNAADTFAKATAWLSEFSQRAPFFLFIHTYEVHVPYWLKTAAAATFAHALDPDYEGSFKDHYRGTIWELGHNQRNPLMAERDVKHIEALYAGEIHYLDLIVDQFFTNLSALPLSRNTLVVVLADHGEEFNEHGKLGHGETLYNAVLHVPLAFYWPGRITPGVSDDLVQLIDVMPTVLDMLGVSNGTTIDGRSLAPLLRSERQTLPPRPAFAELQTAFGDCRRLQLPDDCRVNRLAVQTDRFKLITSMIPEGEAFYDLHEDPGERRDVSTQLPAPLAEHRELLARYTRDTIEPTHPPPERTVDAATRERLRALGYTH